MSGGHLSKDFFELIKAIGESKSKQEEDRIIIREVQKLKAIMKSRGVKRGSRVKKKEEAVRAKEFVIRIIYAEMLGHDASFGYIRAVEMTASNNIEHKRVGYLCAGLCLSPEHEFRFMLVNQLQRDMQSDNLLVVSAALSALCKLITTDMIPALLPHCTELLKHDREIVRKKAVMAMERFWQLDETSVSPLVAEFRRALCDKDPSVMAASLNILHELILKDEAAFKDLVPSFVSVLKQITEHRLPDSYDYHRIPAPWIQIQLLKILATLGAADQKASEGMYEVLQTVMKRADTGINVGYAILYECVRTVTSIYPNAVLLDAAAASISRFISSDNQNLKYLGLTGLASIVKDHPQYTTDHQLIVLDCLEDPDETIKRKTLDLLYRMTNDKNVEVVVAKLLDFLKNDSDEFLRTELVSRITQVAERFAPSTIWYLRTMTSVFEHGGNLVQMECVNALLRIIAEGNGGDEDDDDEDEDEEMRYDAVDALIELTEKEGLPDKLIKTMAWIFGEFGYVINDDVPLPEIALMLCKLAGRQHCDIDTQGFIITALTKVTSQMGKCIPEAVAVMEKYGSAKNTDLQQRCYEFSAMLRNPDLMSNVLPVDASCEDMDIDEELSFLDDFVQTAIDNGARKYAPPTDGSDHFGVLNNLNDIDLDGGSKLRISAYDTPSVPMASTSYYDEEEENNELDEDDDHTDDEANQISHSIGLNGSGLGGGGGPWGAQGFRGSISSTNVPNSKSNVGSNSKVKEEFEHDVVSATSEAVTEIVDDVSDNESETDDQPIINTEEDDRTAMASALFAGIGGNNSIKNKTSSRKAARMARRKKQREARKSLNSEINTDKSSGGGDDGDLLGGDLIGLSLDDTPSNSSVHDASDVFGLGDFADTNNSPDVAHLKVPVVLLQQLGDFVRVPSESEGNVLLNSDGIFHVSYHKVYRPDGLVAVLFITNGSSSNHQCRVVANVPQDLNINFASDDVCLMTDGASAAGEISAGNTAVLLIKMQGAQPSGVIRQSLSVTVDRNLSSPLSVEVPMSLRDWLRPLRMNTKDFGSKWMMASKNKMMSEQKFRLSVSSADPNVYMETAKKKLGVFPIQVIAKTSEAICSCFIAGSRLFLLVHSKVSANGTVSVTARGPRQLTAAFSKFSMEQLHQ